MRTPNSVRILVAGLCATVALSACSLRPIDLEGERPLPLRTTITAADGSLLTRLFRENRSPISYSQIPKVLIDAVLAAEDARFFDHEGFDLRAIVRAAVANAGADEIVQGGSTITQQYVKNVYFTDPDRTIERKARELRLAMELETRYSKSEILERYLNTVYFGSGAYGLKTAVENFFGHGVGRLSPPEAALLASVIKAPALYDPRRHKRRALSRRNYVIARMEELGWISAEEAAEATSAPLGVKRSPPVPSAKQPYFVEAVKREMMRDRRFGSDEDARETALFGSGLRIETTIDPVLQKRAEDAVKGVLNQPGDPEAALVSLRPSTGEIVAMVGGSDWKASQVNLALGKDGGGSGRQPGSSFKPIAAAAAMERGIGLDTRFETASAVFNLGGRSTWPVRNSSTPSASIMNLGDALVGSVNGVYARLALQIGPSAIAGQAELMGVESRLPTFPSIALGSAEVSVLDMAAAYATIANHGTAIEPTTISRIRLSNGSVIEPNQRRVSRAMSPGNAFLLSKTLERVIQQGTGRLADIGRPAAGKTGTTNDFADAWFVGFTPDLATAVWVGYPQGRIPLRGIHGGDVFGGTLPALIWRSFMLAAHRDLPVRAFRLPASEYVTVMIDPISGLRAAPWCPGKRRRMIRDLVPFEFCPVPPPEPVVVETPTPDPTPTKKKDDEGKNAKPDKPKDEPEPKPSPEDPKEPTPEPSPSGD